MATLDSLIIYANPLRHKFQFTMKKLQKRQLTSTLPNSAGAPAVGPPACKSFTYMHVHAHVRIHIHTYTHTTYMHALLGWQAHHGPSATATRGVGRPNH